VIKTKERRGPLARRAAGVKADEIYPLTMLHKRFWSGATELTTQKMALLPGQAGRPNHLNGNN
jgi:hypothetical protein